MDQYSEADVKLALEPFHERIQKVIEGGYAEWLEVKRFMANEGLGPVLYPRTISNFVFDAVVRRALLDFSDDSEVRVVSDAQTVKFCFGEMVLARFKKGDEENLGRNHPTQAVLDFVCVQNALPGLPPEAAKVEILYSATDIEDGIDRIVVAARDGDSLLWHYDLDSGATLGEVIQFPDPLPPSDDDGEQIIKPRVVSNEKSGSDSEGE